MLLLTFQFVITNFNPRTSHEVRQKSLRILAICSYFNPRTSHEVRLATR